MRWTRLFSLIAVATFASSSAYADEKCSKQDEKRSLELFEEGKRAYRLQEFDTAIDAFKKGYALCGNPVFLLNIGLAYRQKSDFANAISFYKSYLKEDPNTDSREKIEQRIAEMEIALEEQKKSKDKPPTEVEPPTTTTTTTEEPPPDPVPTPVPAPVPEPARAPSGVEPWYRDRVGWVLVASGVVAVGVGGALFLHGSSLRDEAASTLDETEVQEMIDSANGYRLIGGLLFWGGTAVTIAGGVKLAITGSAPAKESAKPGTTVMFGPTGFVVSGSF